jgi:hypothetical protein
MTFLRRHQKKLLAIFASFLMIVFILPSSTRMFEPNRNALMGHLGDEVIYADKVRQAQLEWDALKRIYIPSRDPQQRWQPVWTALFPPQLFSTSVMEQIDQHPAMYYLLQREAKRMGAQPNEQAMQQLLEMSATPTADGRIVPLNQADDDRVDLLKASLANLLLVQNAFEHQVDLIKLSQPVKQYELATQAQQISVDLVEFKQADFANRVPAPTPQQLDEQFNKYADNAAGSTTASNPFGFGYRYPNRVKLQYLAVPREDVKKVVKAQKDDWEPEAWRFYLEHPGQFQSTPSTQPTTTASTQASSKPTTAAVASTQPTTRPFAEVHDEALNAVLNPKIDALQTEIINKIKARLAQDWTSYHNATGSTPATTQTASATTKPAPKTTYGVPYDSYEYLQKLAADIQKQTGILPTVASIADTFKGEKELEALPGIGAATQEFLPFAVYATVLAEPFMPAGQKSDRSIALWQPSQVLRDDRTTDYIFRLTAAEKAHKPAARAEVAAAVEADWKKAQAYELAKAQAKQVMESAAKSNLSNAAVGAGKLVVSTGLFANRPSAEVPNYQLDPALKSSFLEQAFDLLTVAAKEKNPHAMGLIGLPGGGKVLLAQLQDVRPAWRNEENMAMLSDMFTQEIVRDMVVNIYNHWFDYDSLTNRLNYRDETQKKKDDTASASVQ